MDGAGGVLNRVREAAQTKVLFLPHAMRQMSKPERMITGPESCLILGYGKKHRPIHVVCSPKDDYLVIITAYLPDPDEWEVDFRRREK